MSSILKALKKAEQESHESCGQDPSSIRPAVLTTLNLRIRRRQKNFSINRTQMVIAAGLVIFTAFFLTFYLMFAKDNPLPQQAAQDTGIKTTHKSPEENEEQFKTQTSNTVQPVRPDEIQKKVTAQRGIDKPPIKKPAPPPPRPDRVNKIFETASPEPPATVIETLDIEKKPEPDMIPMKDGILKIQAISWAETPAERVAVINNKIVEENDFIENYRILHIEKDAVILQLSNQRLKLEFKYR